MAYIIKLNGKYGEWSSICDAPLTEGMSLEDFNKYYYFNYIPPSYPESKIMEFKDRMERVEDNGTSAFNYKGIDDLIKFNRAGEKGECLTKEELIRKYKYE